jgi:hypothetical protein
MECSSEPISESVWSSQLPRKYAISMPRPMPSVKLMSTPRPTLNSVHGRYSKMMSSTDVPGASRELPRSPRATPVRYSQYCSSSGRSGLNENSPAAELAASAYEVPYRDICSLM